MGHVSKRERLEDLGVICEKISSILELPVLDLCDTKHQYEDWLKKYQKEEDDFYTLHMQLRGLHDQLHEIYNIALGDID